MNPSLANPFLVDNCLNQPDHLPQENTVCFDRTINAQQILQAAVPEPSAQKAPPSYLDQCSTLDWINKRGAANNPVCSTCTALSLSSLWQPYYTSVLSLGML